MNKEHFETLREAIRNYHHERASAEYDRLQTEDGFVLDEHESVEDAAVQLANALVALLNSAQANPNGTALGACGLEPRLRELAAATLYPDDPNDVATRTARNALHFDLPTWIATGRDGHSLGTQDLNNVANALARAEESLLWRLSQ